MKLFFLPLLLLLSNCVTTKGSAGPVLPPRVFVLDGDVLKTKKAGITAKDPSLMPAYKKLLEDADKALLEGPFTVMDKKNKPPSGDKHDYMSLAPYFWPDPATKDGLPYIRKDGETNPEVKEYKDKEYMPLLCELVQTLGLAYYFSQNEKYAAHATNLVRTWFLDAATRMNPNLNYGQAIKGVNTGRGAGIIDVRHFMKVIDGVGMLKGSKSWTPANEQGLKNWFGDFLAWMETSALGVDEMAKENNHGTFFDAIRLSIALFTNNADAAKKIIVNVQQRLNSQMDAEGKFPEEMQRTIALHYNVFNLHAFYMIASMAEKTGVDLWKYTSASGASLRKGFDYLHPFITGEKPWKGQQIKPYDFSESYPLLLVSKNKFGCASCSEAVRKLATENTLREYLMY